MNAAVAVAPEASALAYHLLRAALEKFQKTPADLAPEESRQARAMAEKAWALEERVLTSADAARVVIDPAEVDQALATVAERYETPAAFSEDLERNGLDEDRLGRALYRELKFDAVLRRVAAGCEEAGDTDAQLFYEMHLERFRIPERRTARHLLITINPDFAENTPQRARERIAALATEIAEAPERFADLARRHSECPTALEGGQLGAVTRGQLHPEVEAVLFELEAGATGPVVESEAGLHLLLCESIEPGREVPFEEVKDKLRANLTERRRRARQKEWLAGLG